MCCSVTSHVWLFVTPWTAACQASVPLTISQSLHKFAFIASVMPSSHLILWHLLLLLPSVFPSIRNFSSESAVCIRWPKYWSFRFSISPSSEYSRLISRKDWLVWSPCYLRDFQESSPASILWHSAFFMVQLSQLYVATGKTIALTLWTFVCSVMSLLFNTLSRFVTTFLIRHSRLPISFTRKHLLSRIKNQSPLVIV